MKDLRPSPIAGTWYPGDAEALARSVDKQLAEAEIPPAPGPVVGLVAPHAGHRYSGRVAAHAFRAVSGTPFETVAVVAPMHHPHSALVLSTRHQAYWTPLGEVEVDRERLAAFSRLLQEQAGLTLSLIHISEPTRH